MAGRGTKNQDDVLTDLRLFMLNNKSDIDRFNRSDKKIQQVMNKYPDYIKTQSSHSLGTMINAHLQEEYNIDRSLNFNATFHPHDPNLHKYTRNPKNYYISKIGDMISIGILTYSNPQH